MSRSQATGAAGELVAQASLLLRGWVAGNVNSGGRRNSDGQVGRRMGIRLGQIQPQRSRAKMRQFSARASTPRGSREKQPCYHLRCSRSLASAAIRINPTAPRVIAASRSANAVSRQMSALGHKRTYAAQNSMSALTPKADMRSARAHVCLGPISASHTSFDHIVGEAKDRIWNRQADFLRGIEVYYQVELRGLFHG